MIEYKNIISNIKKVRRFLNEAVSDDSIINAIQTHEYIYIYYGGDENTKKGYRTIRPFLMGTHKKSGNRVLRAWQDRGRSHSFDTRPTRPDSYEHDYWTDGGIKPGWRMFRLDRIEQIYPTGRKFEKEGNVLIPPKYNENDKEIDREYWISTEEPDSITKATIDPNQPNLDIEKIKKSEFEKQTKNLKGFFSLNTKKRDIKKDEVEKIYNYVKRVYKKSPNMYVVVVNDDGNFMVRDIKTKYKIPEDRIVGDLSVLYSTLVEPSKGIKPDEKKFFNNYFN